MSFWNDLIHKGELPQDFWEDFMGASAWSFHKKEMDWPLEENGEKVKAVLLKETFDSPAESDMVISMLAAYGIPCFKYYDKDGGAGKVINGFSGYGASLYVPQTMLEDAQNILNAEAVEEDENDAELHE